jgi:lipopolysaccharide export system protein LptA
VFIAIAAMSYRNRSRAAQPEFVKPDELPSELHMASGALKYIVSVNGKNQYEVQASRMLDFKNRRRQLVDVDVLIYAQKPGDPDRRIHGDDCIHDEGEERIVCLRNVSVELEAGTIARTEALSYDRRTSLISSSVETDLERVGEMTGHAGKMDYFVDTGLMRLTDNFVIEMTEGGGIKGGAGLFQYKEHWATVSEGVEMTSTNGRVFGGSGRADLLPGTYRAKRIVVEGGATAESPSLTVNSDWLQADLSDTGSMEHVNGRGNVRAERHAASAKDSRSSADNDSLNGTLTGPEVEAWLDEGNLKALEARQQPVFTGSSGTTLRASDLLRIEPEGSRAGSIRMDGASTFLREGMSVTGRDFLISVKGDAQVFNTTRRAELKSGGLTTRADRTEAHLDTKTNTLSLLRQNGNVSFDEDKTGRNGAAESLNVRNGGDHIELEGGKPWFKDTVQGTLNARKITFDRKEESFVGDGSVRMTTSSKDGKLVVVTSGRVEGRLGEKKQQLDYTGAVQMLPPGGDEIKADRLSVFPKENRFEAAGNVSSRSLGMEVKADKLDFRDRGDNRQTAHYTGKVWTRKTEKSRSMELQTEDLRVELKSGEAGGADTIVATGGVQVTQGTRKGNGQRLEYRVSTGETLLIGTAAAEAEVHESSGNSVKGCTIQIAADGRKNATQCANRSVTSEFKVKN